VASRCSDVGFYVYDSNFEQIEGPWVNPYFRSNEGDPSYFVFHTFALWPAGTDDGVEGEARQYMVRRFNTGTVPPHAFWGYRLDARASCVIRPVSSAHLLTRRPVVPSRPHTVTSATRTLLVTWTGFSRRRPPTLVYGGGLATATATALAHRGSSTPQ